jgi:cardiolipin synthase (CMP-forming)
MTGGPGVSRGIDVTQECQPSQPARAGILRLMPDFLRPGEPKPERAPADGGEAGASFAACARPLHPDGTVLTTARRSTDDPGFGGLRAGGLRALGNPLPPTRFSGERGRKGVVLNLPNLITIARILLVPVVVWAIASNEMQAAFVLFLLAGVSDAVDGFLAKRLHMKSELGAHLDPLADKILIVSIYIALGITEAIPRWIVILVVSRDILIVGGIMLAVFLGKPMKVKPVLVSKLNTAAQIVFACLVLAALAFDFKAELTERIIMGTVAVLTLASIGFYMREWVVHMSAGEIEG